MESLSKTMRPVKLLLTDPKYIPLVAVLLWCGELVLSTLIVWLVPYTEIDWEAYMSEVEGPLLHNDYDYMNLKGATGPLVYPAGFVWIYMGLWHLTDEGKNIGKAQHIFIAIYLLFIAAVYMTYYEVSRSSKQGLPPWILILLSFSRRIHSIFMLRLFNDGIAMLLFYVAVILFARRRWTIGCVFYSLATGVKMNILLCAPALGLILVKSAGWLRTAQRLMLCVGVQVVLAYPFLVVNPWGYLHRSFELGRVFFFKWTVNMKFLPEWVFVSKPLAGALLGVQAILLLIWAHKKWTRDEKGVIHAAFFTTPATRTPRRLSADHIIVLLFECNFIGIVCARSMHYQFYVWYYHTIPLMLHRSKLPVWMSLLILAAVELCWNIFPARPITSALLWVCHAIILLAIWHTPAPAADAIAPEVKTD